MGLDQAPIVMTDSSTRRPINQPGLVYLAGAVDAIDHEEARQWRDVVGYRLTDMGLSSFSPAHAFTICGIEHEESKRLARSVQKVNRLALRRSDALFANIGGPSFGTPVECVAALAFNIPVFVFGGVPNSVYRHEFECWTDTLEEALVNLENWQDVRSGRIVSLTRPN